MPQHAHAHIFINEELFIARHEILRQSLLEAHIAPTEMEEWLKIDLAFKRVLEKASPADCKKRYVDEEIVVIPNPSGRKAS